jgi:hypothetical protein
MHAPARIERGDVRGMTRFREAAAATARRTVAAHVPDGRAVVRRSFSVILRGDGDAMEHSYAHQRMYYDDAVRDL